MKQIIGFATQYYTLWDYEVNPTFVTDSYGNHWLKGSNTTYSFIKNIAMDLDKVKSLYPGVEIDMDLKGTTNWVKEEKKDLPSGYFWFGKYYGKKIDEVLSIDFDYCLWVIENSGNAAECGYIKDSQIYHEYLTAEANKRQAEIDAAELVEVGKEYELLFTTNGYDSFEDQTDYICTQAMLGETKIVIHCDKWQDVWGMYPYIMPCINGKIQRVKNKTIKVKVLEVLDTSNIAGEISQTIKVA